MKRILGLVTTLLVVCGCGSPSDDAGDIVRDVGEASHALREAGTLPVPCNDGKHIWPGTSTELLFSDAMEVCDIRTGDEGMSSVQQHRTSTFDLDGISTSSWREFRANRWKNCDPDDPGQYRSAELPDLEEDEDENPGAGFNKYTQATAPADVMWALKNLCVANYMRNASSSAGLLLPDSDQRELLSTVKQRVQIAMLHFGSLSVVFATGRWSSDDSISKLYEWGRANPALLEEMGRDFATSVALHSVISEELANLIARSRSSNSPTDSDEGTQADRTWGAGSWQHRLMAATFGGDPLAAAQRAPWRNPWENTDPGNVEGYEGSWPTREWQPYVREYVEDPAVRRVVQLLRRFDGMMLPTKVVSTPSGTTLQLWWDTCAVVDDGGASAEGLHAKLEKALQCEALGDTALDCGCHFDGADDCLGDDVALPADEESYLLSSSYGVTPGNS